MLLVVPKAVMSQWAGELAKWGTFHHMVWHGKSAEAACAAAAAGRVEVVTTTLDSFRSDLAHAAGADSLLASSVKMADHALTDMETRARNAAAARDQATALIRKASSYRAGCVVGCMRGADTKSCCHVDKDARAPMIWLLGLSV